MIDAEVKEYIDTRMQRVEELVLGLKEALESYRNEMNGQFQGLRSEFQGLGREFQGLRDSNKGLEHRIAAVETKVDTVIFQISHMTNQYNHIIGQCRDLQTSLSWIQERLRDKNIGFQPPGPAS